MQLRGQDLDLERCVIHLEKGTKGGKVREVLVATEHRGFLQRLKERAGNHRDGCVFSGRGGLGKRLERAVDEACKRLGIRDQGTHGFRGTFAYRRYAVYRGQGLSDRQARLRLAGDLGHGRVEVTYSYVARGA